MTNFAIWNPRSLCKPPVHVFPYAGDISNYPTPNNLPCACGMKAWRSPASGEEE